jgi:hypothetical protein
MLLGERRGGRGMRAGYFVGLLEILHFSNAFFSSAICALVRAKLPLG